MREVMWSDELPELTTLLDFFWNHALASFEIDLKDESSAQLHWRHTAALNFLWMPFARELSDAEDEFLCAKNPPPIWRLPEDRLQRIANELAGWHGEDGFHLGYAPIAGVALVNAADDGFELTSSVRIRSFREGEWQAYASKFHTFFGAHLAPVFQPLALLEVKKRTSESEDIFFDKLDAAKWALFVGLGRQHPIIEDLPVFRGAAGTFPAGLRREPHRWTAENSSLDLCAAERCAALLSDLHSANDDGLRAAVTFFGRASASDRARDMLLDSTMGLDRLLVSGGMEGGHRLRLHGAVLLSGSEWNQTIFGRELSPAEIRESLKEIYGSRSSAAHGSVPKRAKELAATAHRALGYLIAVLMQWKKRGLLQPGDTARAIEEYILAVSSAAGKAVTGK